MPQSIAAKSKTCPSCGAVFHCGPETADGACWCNDLPRLKSIAADSDCLCRACLTKRLKQERVGIRNFSELKEGEDYYSEAGTIVFTAHYHLRRGYCCDSGCRHCPYRQAKPESP